MRNRKKNIIILVALLTLGLAWSVRYVTFNKEIRNNSTAKKVIKYNKIGEWVPFGNNYMVDSYCNGYFIRIEGFRILDYDIYMQELAELGYREDEQRSYPQVKKILEVEITLKNKENVDKGINFLDTWLFGEDFYMVLVPKWFEVVNSFDANSMGGVSLRTDTEYRMKLPYSMTEITYREKLGRRLEKEKLWMRLTGYPEERWVRVQ